MSRVPLTAKLLGVKRRIRCPQCGDLALERRRYRDGSTCYVHEGYVEGIVAPYLGVTITRSCHIKAVKS